MFWNVFSLQKKLFWGFDLQYANSNEKQSEKSFYKRVNGSLHVGWFSQYLNFFSRILISVFNLKLDAEHWNAFKIQIRKTYKC